MKILVITNYWVPWNCPGTFRWWNFSQYINCDILTSKKPKGGFYDETIKTNGKAANAVYRIGSSLPCCCAVLFFAFYIFCCKKMHQYDIYIISSPPESLLILAYVLQLFGKKVLVDMRDSMSHKQRGKKYKMWLLTPVYKFFYRRIKNVVVCMQFLDPSKKCVHSGHNGLTLSNGAVYQRFDSNKRYPYAEYNNLKEKGWVPNNKRDNYSSLDLIDLRHLGYDLNKLMPHLHDEIKNLNPNSWEVQAGEMLEVIRGSIFN